jgi:hypothetical protein
MPTRGGAKDEHRDRVTGTALVGLGVALVATS